MFGVFHDAGDTGMYGGLGSKGIGITRRKGIAEADNLLDRMDTTELAANQFRLTQARDRLARDGMRGEQRAIDTHEAVGREVRAAIERIGGTMPEDIAPAEHVREVERWVKEASSRVDLDGARRGGVAGGVSRLGLLGSARSCRYVDHHRGHHFERNTHPSLSGHMHLFL
jgi:DNA-damage-inducible protein D